MSLSALGQATSTMNQLQLQMDMIGNNLANMNTHGFKQGQAQFSSLLHQHMQNISATPENSANRMTPVGIRVGTGAKISAIQQQHTIGAFQSTDRNLDTALKQEKHFYKIATNVNGNEAIQYTRNGAFYVTPVSDANVMLVTSDGNPVLGEDDQPILLARNFNQIDITQNGEVIIHRDGSIDVAGKIGIVQIDRPGILEAAGGNLFRMPNLAALGLRENDLVTQLGDGDFIQSGGLEASNVDVSEQMTDLIAAQRAYQMNARTVSMADQMQGLINQLR